MLKHLSRQWLAIVCLTAITTACGGGGGSGGSNANNASGTSSGSTSSTSAATTSSTSTSSTTSSTSESRLVHITWSAPTTRADGSALPASALSSYRLFYLRDGSSSSEDTVITINGGTTTSTDLSLSLGTYTFAITAIDSSGAESALSTPVSITIN